MNEEYDIVGWRLGLGVLAGAGVAIICFVILLLPIWHFVLVVGAALAVIVVSVVGVPLYVFLFSHRILNVYLAILVGGLLTTLPYVIYTVYRLQSTFIHVEKSGNTTLIVGNKLTNEGWWHYFFWEPLWFLPPGMIGGLIA